MKRRYKLLLIIVVGVIFAIIINFSTVEDKTSLVAIGDGVALGMTAYNVVGTSFNDYLRDYFDSKNKLQNYNNDFSIEHLSVEELNDCLDKNEIGSKSKTPIKQIIAKADIITIAVGMDEFIDLSIKNKINEDRIDKYIQEYVKVIEKIRLFYDKDIIIISLYPIYDFDKSTVYDINKELQKLSGENKIIFLDITAISLNPEYYANNTSYYMNYKGHQAIYNQLLKNI